MFHFIKRRRGLRFRSQAQHRPVEKPIHKWWKGQSNPRCTSQQIRLNTCETCSQHPPLAPKSGINGQNDVNADINNKIMLINGSILMTTSVNSQSQSTGVKKVEKPNMDITKHTQMCLFGKNHVQPTARRAPLWKSHDSRPGRCVQNLTNSAAQLPADAAGQPGRSSIPGLYYHFQSSQQRGQTQNVVTRLCQSFFVGIFSLICHSVC